MPQLRRSDPERRSVLEGADGRPYGRERECLFFEGLGIPAACENPAGPPGMTLAHAIPEVGACWLKVHACVGDTLV